MNITRIVLLITIFGVALLLGFKTGEQIDPIKHMMQVSLDATAMPDVPIPDNDQFNLLIIGVNDIDELNTPLETIWLVAYTQATPQVTLVPVFPSLDNTQQNQLLDTAFYLDGGKPSKEFWDVMRKTDLWWKGYIIIDMSTTIKMINLLGGIEVNGRLANGAQIVSTIPYWKDDPDLALERQKTLLEGVCNRMTEIPRGDLEIFGEIFQRQPQDNVKMIPYIVDWAAMAIVSQKPTCKFPTLTSEEPYSKISIP